MRRRALFLWCNLKLLDLMIRDQSEAFAVGCKGSRADLIDLMARILVAVFQVEWRKG